MSSNPPFDPPRPPQLVAGEQIDHYFGAKLGLSVLASAGLGNLVADVVGVSATHTIQDNIKRIGFAQPPRLRCAGASALPCGTWVRVCGERGGVNEFAVAAKNCAAGTGHRPGEHAAAPAAPKISRQRALQLPHSAAADPVSPGQLHLRRRGRTQWHLGPGPLHDPCSMLQQQMSHVRWAQLAGAALGVAAGCLMGMTPLLFMEPGFFVGAADAAASAAAALGPVAGGSGGEQAATDAAAAVAATAAALAADAPAAPAEAAAAAGTS